MVLSLFSIPISGILGQASSLAAISDNIANQGSAGSKTSSVRFRPVLSQQQSISQLDTSAHGLSPYTRQNIDRQGVTLPTGRPLDFALNGGGFFAVQHPQSGEVVYTRNGQFQILIGEDGLGYLGDSDGYYVLGWRAEEGQFSNRDAGSLARIPFDDTQALSGSASSNASIAAVLPTREGEIFQHSLELIDTNGQQRSIGVTYRRGTEGAWRITLADSGGRQIGTGVLGFDERGSLQRIDGRAVQTLRLSGEGLEVDVDLSQIRVFGGTEGGSVPVLLRTSRNGIRGGSFVAHEVDERGVISAIFSNGQERVVGQVAIADLVNPNSFEPLSGTKFRRSAESGGISYYDLTSTRRARLETGSLESSTTELADAFVALIETQSAFTLSALSLQTINEITQTATQIKR